MISSQAEPLLPESTLDPALGKVATGMQEHHPPCLYLLGFVSLVRQC